MTPPTSNLPRPASFPDLRSSPASSSTIATLEPFQLPSGAKGGSALPTSSHRSGGSRRGRRQGARNEPVNRNQKIEILPGCYESISYEKYLVIKSLGGQSIMDLDIFDVHRTLVKVCGREPKVTPQRDGSLLVEVASQEEANRLRDLSAVPGADVSCTPHATLNQSKGVVFARDLLRFSEEKLLQELSDEGVIAVHRFQKKVDGVLTPTPSLLLTFNSLILPDSIRCAWYRLGVKPYIPNPRRCFHCQSFGHVARSCRRLQSGLPSVCVSCGGGGHNECPGPVKCYHCGDPHPASSKDCDRYKFEREILLIRTQTKVSFPEARKQALTRLVSPGTLYASVVKKFRPPQERDSPPKISRKTEERREPSATHQKRSRSEDSLEESPPNKIQPPEPPTRLEEAQVVAAVAVTASLETSVDERQGLSGTEVAGDGRPAPASSTSRHQGAEERRPASPLKESAGSQGRVPTVPPTVASTASKSATGIVSSSSLSAKRVKGKESAGLHRRAPVEVSRQAAGPSSARAQNDRHGDSGKSLYRGSLKRQPK